MSNFPPARSLIGAAPKSIPGEWNTCLIHEEVCGVDCRDRQHTTASSGRDAVPLQSAIGTHNERIGAECKNRIRVGEEKVDIEDEPPFRVLNLGPGPTGCEQYIRPDRQ